VKRFWTRAEAVPDAGGHAIHLDGKPVRTPAKAPLILPTPALAQAVVAEWQAQGDRIDPAAMPLTRSANSAIDKVAPAQAEVARIVASYGATDLLCYRAGSPGTLVAAQMAWDAPLDWAKSAIGVHLRVVQGVMPVAQDPAALAILGRRVAGFPPFELTALHDLVALSGSLVLGLAVADGALAADEAWRLSRIDEDFQIAQWGEDVEAAAAAARRQGDFLHAQRFLALART
jgi:chaperone required for assembly of F1-ATPase